MNRDNPTNHMDICSNDVAGNVISQSPFSLGPLSVQLRHHPLKPVTTPDTSLPEGKPYV